MADGTDETSPESTGPVRRLVPKLTRDLVLFVLGLGGAVNQLFIAEKADYVALAFCGLLLGLGPILRLDEKRRGSE